MRLPKLDLFEMVAISYVACSFILALIGRTAELLAFVVAGAISLAFLKLELFKEFSGGGFRAKLKERVEKVELELEPLKLKGTEPEESEIDRVQDLERSLLNEEQQKVLLALTNSHYSWRTLKGIESHTQLSRDTIIKALLYLEHEGLSLKGMRATNKVIWSATRLGYDVSRKY